MAHPITSSQGSSYVQDPDNDKKQFPAQPPPNAYDRTVSPAIGTLTKTPNYVLVTKTMTKPFGFYFGGSASFAKDATTEGGATLTGSSYYDSDWGLVTVGTRLEVHPSAWSGSSADAGNIRFVYKSGRSTGGR